MNKREVRIARKYLATENKKYPETMVEIPRGELPPHDQNLMRVFRSRYFLAQFYTEASGVFRLSVNRTSIDDSGKWEDGITWDDLMAVKREIGFGEWDAVEAYPRDSDVVNVANVRHLWILPERPPYFWKRA